MTETSESSVDWEAPATKGDVVLSLIHMRGLALALYKMMGAFTPSDQERLRAGVHDFDEAWDGTNKALIEMGIIEERQDG